MPTSELQLTSPGRRDGHRLAWAMQLDFYSVNRLHGVSGKLCDSSKPEGGLVMGRAIEKLKEEIRSLSPEQKVELLRSLITELDAPADLDVEQAWLEEAQRRHRELIEGKVKGVPGERVFENLRSRLGR